MALLLLGLLGSLHPARAQTPVSWWRADGDATDAIGGNNGTLSGGVTFGPGAVNQGFVFDGSNGVINIPDSPSLAFDKSLRITAEIYVNALPSYLGQIFFRGDDRSGLDPYGLVVESDGNLDFHLSDAQGNNADITAPVPLQQWVSVDVSLDDATGLMLMSFNGQLVAEMPTSIRPFRDLDPTQDPGLAIGNTQDPSSYDEPFNGTIDELKVYDTAFCTNLLWDNANGSAAIWSIATDNSVTSTPALGPFAGWTAKTIADGSDGKTRLLWTRSDGMNAVWTVNDADGTYTSTPGYGPYDSGRWTVASLAVGADNRTRLQWKHSPDGMSSVWTVAADGSFTSTPGYGPYGPWTASALADGNDGFSRLL